MAMNIVYIKRNNKRHLVNFRTSTKCCFDSEITVTSSLHYVQEREHEPLLTYLADIVG